MKEIALAYFEKRFLKDCFAENKINSYTFKEKIQMGLLEFIKPFGELKFFPDFPKPFFKIDQPNLFFLVGAVGVSEIRVTFKKDAPRIIKEWLENQFEKSHICLCCGKCAQICKRNAISCTNGKFVLDYQLCNRCLLCVKYRCKSYSKGGEELSGGDLVR